MFGMRRRNYLALAKEWVNKCRDSCGHAEDDLQEAECRLDQAIEEYSQVRDKQHGSLDLSGLTS